MHIDNSEDVVENVTRKIVNFIKQGEVIRWKLY